MQGAFGSAGLLKRKWFHEQQLKEGEFEDLCMEVTKRVFENQKEGDEVYRKLFGDVKMKFNQ